MQTQQEETLTPLDLNNIHSLVEAIATEKGFHRENSYFLLETEFNIASINQLKRYQFEHAIALLVGLQDIIVH